jgi:hypothetical protein
VLGVFVILLVLIIAWGAPTKYDILLSWIALACGTLFLWATSKFFDRMSPLTKSVIYTAIATLCVSIIIPFSHALIMGLAGLIFNVLNNDEGRNDKPE